MSNGIAPDFGNTAQNVSERAITLAEETSRWIAGNFVGILLAAGIGVLIALALLALRSLGSRMMRRGRNDLHWRIIFARALARTSLFFIVFVSAELVAEHASTPSALLSIIHFLFVIAAAFQAAVWARELILGYVEHRVGPQAANSSLGSATSIIRLLVSVALFAIAVVLILDNLGVNVTGLVAGLGIGGIAIGLAAQGIFSDLFAALSILFDKPFKRGDAIRFEDIIGTVEQIGLKTTRIRATTGEQVVVSNANLLSKELHNFANLDRRQIVLRFGIICQTPPDLCAQLPEMMRTIVDAQKKTRMIRCGMVGFGASTLDFELAFDVHSRDWDIAFATRNAVCIAMLEAFAGAGIHLGYPSQTSFTAAPDGRLIMPYPTGAAGGGS